ncbi:MAG: regulatory protein [Sphingobacteriales bacterium]|jgi:regulatory protein
MNKLRTKMAELCAKRECCKHDIELRLQKYKIAYAEIIEIVESLAEEGLIDEQRYAHAYTHDHFKFNKWGKHKIKTKMLQKGIPTSFIQEALDGISPDEYHKVIERVLFTKYHSLRDDDNRVKWMKLSQFAYQRGYEAHLIKQILSLILDYQEKE